MRLMPPRPIVVLLLTVAAVTTLAAQSIAVAPDRIGEFKTRYPYVRFELLSGFAVPDSAKAIAPRSPHAAAPSGSSTLTLPPGVRALDGARVSVRGYMLPLELEAGHVRLFILTSTFDACHFGSVGQVNEWMIVRLGPRQWVEAARDAPVTVFGTLSIHPHWDVSGLSGLYELAADAIVLH